MKKATILIACALWMSSTVMAQNIPTHTSNYQLAERFSAAKMRKMTYSNAVNPTWLKDGNSFWYSYKTA